MSSAPRRVVITGIGVISPLGCNKDALWDALSQGRSGVGPLTTLPADTIPVRAAAEVSQFRGEIEDFGPLEKEQKKAIRKGLKVMCRECQMGVAVAQLALTDAKVEPGQLDPKRTGVSYGTDFMITVPEEFHDGIVQCSDEHGFHFPRWGTQGLAKMSPLWLLKYLPNMPASHVAIFNDFRGPNNSLTMREAAGNMAVGEAFQIIRRGSADAMLCGATGTRLHAMKILHALQQEEVACGDGDPARLSRPFDANRTGMVLGEGAGAVLLEELGQAQARGATIYGEVLAGASRSVSERPLVSNRRRALAAVLTAVLQSAAVSADGIGHLHAHGLSTRTCDIEEAAAIAQVFGGRSRPLPITATKSYCGNLGAGSGMVELAASLLALGQNRLPRVLNYETPDPDCPVAVVTGDATPAGDSFITLSVTPQGQAGGLLVGRVE
jgi:3-oxoacyl-[acyl-carrier-protein] synthase II